MLEWCAGGVRYRVSLLFPALITALLLCQPDMWTVSCMVASLVHECGHLIVMLLLGVPPRECVLGAFGIRICLGNRLIDYRRNLLISLAGPCANGLVAVAFAMVRCFTAASIHLALAAVNLLPVTALDGGEIVRGILSLLGYEAKAERVLRLLSILILLPLAAISFVLFCVGGNPTLLIVGSYAIALLIFRKS